MAAKKVDPAAAMKRTRADAVKYAERSSAKALRRLLLKAQAELNKRIVAAIRGPGADSFTAAQAQAMLAQVTLLLRDLRPGIKSVVQDVGGAAGRAATKNALDYLTVAEKQFKGVTATLPLKHALMFDRVARKTDASVLRRLSMSEVGFKDPVKAKKVKQGILERYGESVVADFEDKLMLAVATKKPLSEVREELKAASPFLRGAPAHWAERIVRTEAIAAYSAAGHASIHEAQQTLGDMVKILSATFDGRTGADSYAVHGQIRRPEEPFEAWGGRLYMHPPNRPNDREIVVPHRISWPIPPELTPKSDGEVAARWKEEGRKGAVPPRPKLTTVPLEQFGKPAEA